MDAAAKLEVAARDLESLEELWAGDLGEDYDFFRDLASDSRVALAAALVEAGLTLQGVGSHVAGHGELLLGDLCLARASRLLADAGDQRLQVAFARTVERIASEAAGGDIVSPVRPLLVEALAGR